jgi:hypothetical protein
VGEKYNIARGAMLGEGLRKTWDRLNASKQYKIGPGLNNKYQDFSEKRAGGITSLQSHNHTISEIGFIIEARLMSKRLGKVGGGT